MGNNRIVLVILVLVIAGTVMIGFLPQSPNQPTSNTPRSELNSPSFSEDFNLPNLLVLQFWPTAAISPTSSLQPTTTPIPTLQQTPTVPPTPTVPVTAGPQPTAPPNASGACAWMDNELPHVTEYYPNGGTAMPATTREVCAFNRTSYYSLPFRNANCQATQVGIDRAFERMKTFYPNYWQSSKLLQDWQTVQQYAIKYNFNPLFVISLWIEESAAGGATQAQKLGCVNRRNRDNTYTTLPPSSTVCEQMECLFGLQSANPANYALWACNYRYGSNFWVNNHCTSAINFTMTLEFWYNFIGENLPSGCRAQYFTGADSRCQSF